MSAGKEEAIGCSERTVQEKTAPDGIDPSGAEAG